MIHLNDFNFDLPLELIARYPLPSRSSSRLLCVNEEQEEARHRRFSDVLGLIQPGDLLVFNDTKVIPARLYGQKTTGGQVEVLVERILDKERIVCQLRVSKPPKVGDKLLFPHFVTFEVLKRADRFYELRSLDATRSILEIIDLIGEIPLPHYMDRAPEESDKERYQTIYAKHKGSVAAPTAGFHFDEPLMEALRQKQVEMAYLTLHIGAGTFAPVRVENITEHTMHAEYLEVSVELCEKIAATKARGGRVIAVGTTSLRALETASQRGVTEPYQGDTSIFIYPGYHFHAVDALITNLHLPCSTLLMLVCAFGGHARVMAAYREAVERSYRFYSYGDAMWLTR